MILSCNCSRNTKQLGIGACERCRGHLVWVSDVQGGGEMYLVTC